jgi:hypothetical protein
MQIGPEIYPENAAAVNLPFTAFGAEQMGMGRTRFADLGVE